MVALMYGLAIALAEIYKRSGNTAKPAIVCVWIVGVLGSGLLGAAETNIGTRHRIEEVVAFFALTAASALSAYFLWRRYKTFAFIMAITIFGLDAAGSLVFALRLLGG